MARTPVASTLVESVERRIAGPGSITSHQALAM